MVIDVIVFGIVILAILKGYKKGLIVAVFSFLAVLIGLAAAIKLSAVVAVWLHNSTKVSSQWLPFLSFIIIMIGVAILVRLGAKAIETAVKFALMGWLNKLGGIVLYVVLYITVFSIVLFYLQQMNVLKPAAINNSQTYFIIKAWGPKAINGFGVIIPWFKNMFTQLENFFQS
jgi:membrane protein required for colicin V production